MRARRGRKPPSRRRRRRRRPHSRPPNGRCTRCWRRSPTRPGAMMEAARGQAEQVRAAARTDAAPVSRGCPGRGRPDRAGRPRPGRPALRRARGGFRARGHAGRGHRHRPRAGRLPRRPCPTRTSPAGSSCCSLSSGERFSIGRAPGSDIQLPWDDAVSRRHARFERAGEDWVVVDDGMSSNGTFVNEEQVSGKRRLRDGDVVRAGATRMTFHERVGGARAGPARRRPGRICLIATAPPRRPPGAQVRCAPCQRNGSSAPGTRRRRSPWARCGAWRR